MPMKNRRERRIFRKVVERAAERTDADSEPACQFDTVYRANRHKPLEILWNALEMDRRIKEEGSHKAKETQEKYPRAFLIQDAVMGSVYERAQSTKEKKCVKKTARKSEVSAQQKSSVDMSTMKDFAGMQYAFLQCVIEASDGAKA